MVTELRLLSPWLSLPYGRRRGRRHSIDCRRRGRRHSIDCRHRGRRHGFEGRLEQRFSP